MKNSKKILFFVSSILLSQYILGCNNLAQKDANKKSLNEQTLNNNVRVESKLDGTTVKLISVEKNFRNLWSPLSEKSNYLIKFNIADAEEKHNIFTLKDSVCLYMGFRSYKEGRVHASFSHNSIYLPKLHRKVILKKDPIRLYLPFEFMPKEDSVFYYVYYSKIDSSYSSQPAFMFKVYSGDTIPLVKLGELKK